MSDSAVNDCEVGRTRERSHRMVVGAQAYILLHECDDFKRKFDVGEVRALVDLYQHFC